MFINEKYEIKTLDERNVTLIEHRISESGKTKGSKVEKVIGYYPSVNAVLKGLCKKEIHGTGLRDIETINVKIDLLYKWIDEAISKGCE